MNRAALASRVLRFVTLFGFHLKYSTISLDILFTALSKNLANAVRGIFMDETISVEYLG